MLVFRSLTLGLLGACVLLLAQRPSTHVHLIASGPEPAPAVTARPSSVPTIINIATKECHLGSGVFTTCFATDLMPLLSLQPAEQITAVGDAKVADAAAGFEELARANGMDAATFDRSDLAELATSSALWFVKKEHGRYLDLVIEGPRGERRVLVLMH